MLKKKTEFWLLFLWNVPAFALSFLIGKNYLITAFLFFVIPSIFISIRRPGLIKQIAFISLILIIPTSLIANYLAHVDGSWLNFSTVGVRLFNTYPLDDFLWGFLYFYYIFAFYEYFFDKHEVKKKIPDVFYKFTRISLIVAFLFCLLIFFFPGRIHVPYFYSLLVIVFFMFLPAVIIYHEPKIFNKLIKAGLFFAFLSLLYEYVANIKHNWIFPGIHFLGHVSILSVRFPLEEFLWLFFCVPAILAYYEFFADDRK